MLGSNQLRPHETMGARVDLLDGFVLRTTNLRRIGMAYTLLWCALLLWGSLASGSFWFTGNIDASPASQVMAACALLTPLLIPFVVCFPALRTGRNLNSVTSRFENHLVSFIRGPGESTALPILLLLSSLLVGSLFSLLYRRKQL